MRRSEQQRGQAPLPDLFYSQLLNHLIALESENRTSQEEGLAPAPKDFLVNFLIL